MRITQRLFQQPPQLLSRITLFTRSTCGLCTQGRAVLSDVWDQRPFDYKEVDIIDPANQAWRDLYDIDVPVIHFGAAGVDEDPKKASKAVKLMHRFTVDAVKAKMDLVEAKAGK